MSAKIDVHAEHLAFQCKGIGLPEPVREFRFSPLRRWRFDLAFPDRKIAVEIDGGIWTQGRHSRGTGYAADCEKLARAAILGWRVLRFPVAWVKSGRAIGYLEEVLKS